MKNNIRSILSDLLFYGVLVIIVVAVLSANGQKSNGPRVIGGYSAFVVLTSSMEDVIPKGSLVITKSVDAGELKIGDDITYMVSEKTTVTHRIIAIEEEYLTTGERAFTTKGTMNAEADRMPVAAVNVVGKVIYHSKPLGDVISFGQENWPLVIFFIVVAVVFIKIIAHILKKEEKQEKKAKNENETKAEPEKKAKHRLEESESTKAVKAKQTKKAEKQKEKQTQKAEKRKKKQAKKRTEPEIPERENTSRIIEDEDGFMMEIIDL